MTTHLANRSHRFLAVLMASWSIGWWQFLRQSGAEGWLPNIVPLILGWTGLYVAWLLWRGDRRLVAAFSYWAVADLIGLVLADAQVEPIFWKVALGAFLSAVFLVSIGVYLRSAHPAQLAGAAEI